MSKALKRKRTSRQWQEIVQQARGLREASLAVVQPPFPRVPDTTKKNVTGIAGQILSPEECNITSAKPEDLLDALASKALSATEVTNAFLRRAALSQNLTNCVTELLTESALSRATSLDALPNLKGPLHGLPVSIKEHFGIANRRLHAGYVAYFDKFASKNALIVDILENAGAVIFARTTEPQGMMQLETDSNLYGVTVNPLNIDLSAGGSSGGEGALIGCNGSILGVGSDVGGSIRVPAAANGIYGLKPTSSRIPTMGWSSTPAGADPIQTVLGPLSTSLAGISTFMSAVLAAEPWLQEPALVPLPWRQVRLPGKLKIGIMYDDGIVKPHPPISRMLKYLEARLEDVQNVRVVPFRAHKHDEAWAITSSLYYTDGGSSDLKLIRESGEPVRPLTRWMITENPCVNSLTRAQLEYWLEEREEFRKEYNEYWNATGTFNDESGKFEDVIDVLLCPVAPWIASRHGTAKYWSYTSTWNLLDWPALVAPVSVADKSVDFEQRSEFWSAVDEEIWDMCESQCYANRDDLKTEMHL
ncbi:MAG: hypothetical protein M1820_007506 [Bogoriella megaspora]|nr:MAG: hypothetical protein M1820_007506 [Bogoriella megaspora]